MCDDSEEWREYSWCRMLSAVGTYDNAVKDKLGRPVVAHTWRPPSINHAFHNFKIK
jgi:hypothetical protein